jgi:hypothetical protein
LSPPPESKVSWEEYIGSEPGNHPTLGRNLVYKETSKAFKATVAMVSKQKYVSICFSVCPALIVFGFPLVDHSCIYVESGESPT